MWGYGRWAGNCSTPVGIAGIFWGAPRSFARIPVREPDCRHPALIRSPGIRQTAEGGEGNKGTADEGNRCPRTRGVDPHDSIDLIEVGRFCRRGERRAAAHPACTAKASQPRNTCRPTKLQRRRAGSPNPRTASPFLHTHRSLVRSEPFVLFVAFCRFRPRFSGSPTGSDRGWRAVARREVARAERCARTRARRRPNAHVSRSGGEGCWGGCRARRGIWRRCGGRWECRGR